MRGASERVSKNYHFLASQQKGQKSEDLSNLGSTCRHFGFQNMTFEVSFGIVFHYVFFFSNGLKARKVFVFKTFQWFWTIKKYWCSDSVSLSAFMFFSKPLPRTVIRMSQRRTFLNNCFGEPFSIFMLFKRAPFGRHFRAAGHQKTTTPNSDLRPGADIAFHETIAITVPFAPSVFLNTTFSMKIGSFSDLTAFLCAMFYMHFLSH